MTNYYDILGLTYQADLTEIKTAYRKLSKKFHPDLNPNEPYFERMFLRIQEAYEVLSDPQNRKTYDDLLKNNQAKSHDFIQPNVLYPTILNFSINKAEIKEGETFTLTWDVKNVDFVEIKPFGRFSSNGIESFKLKKLQQPQINIILTAHNADTGATARDYLMVENASYNKNILNYLYKDGYAVFIFRIFLFLLIIAFLVLLLIFGVEVHNPLQELRNK
ncbi:DnaJ domain-containing protein [Flavobacteriaceae bacterium Ap0902]|nr:DnaJ domain-containing protein [Flavobacteriaceae bacterium Ap0902]